MKKLAILSMGIFLVACGNGVKTTSQAKTETMTTTTAVPVIKKVSYELTDSEGDSVIIEVHGRDNVVTKASMISAHDFEEGQKFNESQQKLMVKVMEDQLLGMEGYAKVKDLEGVSTEITVTESSGKLVITFDYEKINYSTFHELSGQGPYEFMFGVDNTLYSKSLPFDTAEAILETEGGKKIEQ